MYTPKPFKEDNQETLLQIMKENAFATIISTDKNGIPIATPLPFLIKQEKDQIILKAHFAKANSQWKHLETNNQVLVIFNGPHCYISPSWYKKSGVPTWNYVTVQCYGPAKLLDNQQTAELIETLSDQYEQEQDMPWKAENNYSAKMLDAIVGFEINVHHIQGKVKIGQNKSEGDLIGVINALKKSSSENDKAIADLIKKYLETKD